MKSKVSFIITLWSVMLAFCLGVLLLCFAEKDTRASEKENRMLQGMPEFTAENVLSGNFSGEFEGYLSDGFFARNLLINYSNDLLDLFSVQTLNDKILLEGGEDELQGVTDSQNTSSSVPQGGGEATNTEDSQNDHSSVETNNEQTTPNGNYGFFYRKTDGSLYPLFSTSDERHKLIAHALNEYRAQLPEDGNVFYMMIPLQNNYSPVDNGDYTGWYSNTEDAISEQTDDGVYVINAPAVLESHIDEDIYFPIDHHWSALGAYYLCEEVITMQGLPMMPYNEYNYKIKYGYNVSNTVKGWFDIMYPLQNVSSQLLYEDSVQNTKFMDYSANTYGAYLGGRVVPWSKYITGFNTGRKALVIGDSFANAFTPYLCPYYDEVHATDVRKGYYDAPKAGGWIAELMKKYNIDDVYIVVSYANAANSATSYERLEACLYGY